MKLTSAVAFTLYVLTAQSQIVLENDPAVAAFYAQKISVEHLEKYVYQLASKEFQGRETGTKGQKKAADFISDHFNKIGLKGIGEHGTHYQTIPFIWDHWNNISVQINEERYVHLRHFLSLPDMNNNLPELERNEVVFLGYGIDDENYSDYGEADLKGKVIMIYSGEPINDDSISYITGTNALSIWNENQELKLQAAARHQVAVVLFIDPDITRSIRDNRRRVLQRQYRVEEITRDNYPNSVSISPAMTRTIIGENWDAFIDVRTRIRETGSAKPLRLPCEFTLNHHLVREPIYSENIIGVLEGSDSTLKDEVVVLSAHYDHLGMRGNSIYFGADDNATGTSAVMAIMEALSKAKSEGYGPRRSVVAILFTGEEKGLLGSEYYSNNPVFPLENTVANINVDMIGRYDESHAPNPHYIYVIGSDRLSTDLHLINETVNNEFIHLQFDYTYNEKDDPNRFYYRSDHYNFAKNGIPSVFYFSGTHEDYHQPSDTPDKIIFDKLVIVSQLIFHTTYEIANRDERIRVNVVDDTNYSR